MRWINLLPWIQQWYRMREVRQQLETVQKMTNLMDLSLEYWRFNTEIMDFTIYKVKSTKILNKSEDLSGFQGEILWQKYRINNSNVNGLWPYQLTDNFRINHNSHRSSKDHCNTIWNTPLDHQTITLITEE